MDIILIILGSKLKVKFLTLPYIRESVDEIYMHLENQMIRINLCP